MSNDTKRHYDTHKLLEHYRETFQKFMPALMIGVGGAVVFFFAFIVYLGGWGHTKTEDFQHTFGDRIEYEYKGTKLPLFGGPAEPETQEHHE